MPNGVSENVLIVGREGMAFRGKNDVLERYVEGVGGHHLAILPFHDIHKCYPFLGCYILFSNNMSGSGHFLNFGKLYFFGSTYTTNTMSVKNESYSMTHIIRNRNFVKWNSIW
jgi:hypothetical protein